MKQPIILWVSAFIITFLAGSFQNRISGYYPISGTFGIEGKRVSYYLEKVHNSKEDLKILIRSDANNLYGAVKWRVVSSANDWQIDSMKNINGDLISFIPKQNPQTEVEYKLILTHEKKEYFLPSTETQKVIFLGTAPEVISIHYYLTLFLAMLLSTRVGLEYFNPKPRIRFYSIFTLILFFTCALIFAPIKKAYEMGIIGSSVPTINKVFQLWLIILLVLWIAALLLASFTKKPKIFTLIISIVTLIVFITQNIW